LKVSAQQGPCVEISSSGEYSNGNTFLVSKITFAEPICFGDVAGVQDSRANSVWFLSPKGWIWSGLTTNPNWNLSFPIATRDSLQYALAKIHDLNEEYRKAWEIFEDLNNKGYEFPNNYMAKYLINGLHVKLDIKRAYEICNKEENANTFHERGKFIEKWNIIAKLSESKTEYNFDAKFWMAKSLSRGLGVNKDEERAYNYLKEVSNHFNHNLEENYYKLRVEDRRLCIEVHYNDNDPVVNIARSKYFFIDAKIDKLAYLNYPFMRVLVLDKYPLNYLKFYIAEFFKSFNVKETFNVLYNIDKDKSERINPSELKDRLVSFKINYNRGRKDGFEVECKPIGEYKNQESELSILGKLQSKYILRFYGLSSVDNLKVTVTFLNMIVNNLKGQLLV
ncbi:45554_t:CDS:2, partial [Gigaspora margarita]